MSTQLRILAWGNTGRRDDGVALRLAEQLATDFTRNPAVRVDEFHQLSPELADELQESEVVIFIDAHVRNEWPNVVLKPVKPASTEAMDTHCCSPQVLLRLAQALGRAVPEAYLLMIRAHDTEFGDSLSPRTRQAMQQARGVLMSFIQRRLQPWSIEPAVQHV